MTSLMSLFGGCIFLVAVRSGFGRALHQACLVPFRHNQGVMQPEVRIKVGSDSSEIVELFQRSTAIEVTLVIREDESESIPARVGFTVFHVVQEPDQLPQR